MAEKRGLRTGFTTGACAAAAAKAAARLLLLGQPVETIATTLPNGQAVTFTLSRCGWVNTPDEDGQESNSLENNLTGKTAECAVVKDAGDDPDVTHGAELVARVRPWHTPGVQVTGGQGVALVTRPGLGLEVGTHAINPVPRRNITDMVRDEWNQAPPERRPPGLWVEISVPGGEELAKKTLNARLGLVGGISILGTTGIVRPYSTAAFKASVVQAVDVARAQGQKRLVFTTGGRTEQAAFKLFPGLAEVAFIQVGDFIGAGLRQAARQPEDPMTVEVVGMAGKLAKMADGRMMTHASGSEVNTALLGELARQAGASESLAEAIAQANTARHALELAVQAGLKAFPAFIARRAAERCRAHIHDKVSVNVWLVDFDGSLLAQCPE
ncbi:MAG: cobalt-precorrin-5B (C(1))-methyltransferase [Deltaproteobacteria bacterium]|nr:cobalt-precorrin-5B (C(1))-methyltransferase [Deltaproteobacteria bacterium]